MAHRNNERSLLYRKILRQRQEEKGVPLERFCRKRGISVWSYYYWRKRLDHSEVQPVTTAAPSPRTFLPVTLSGQLPQGRADFTEVVFRDGTIVRFPGGFEAQRFSAIAAVVRGSAAV